MTNETHVMIHEGFFTKEDNFPGFVPIRITSKHLVDPSEVDIEQEAHEAYINILSNRRRLSAEWFQDATVLFVPVTTYLISLEEMIEKQEEFNKPPSWTEQFLIKRVLEEKKSHEDKK
jgi:hypothetical protein